MDFRVWGAVDFPDLVAGFYFFSDRFKDVGWVCHHREIMWPLFKTEAAMGPQTSSSQFDIK